MAFTIGTAALRDGFRHSAGASVRERVCTDCKDGGQERDSGTLLGFPTWFQNLFWLDFVTAIGVPTAVDGVLSRHSRMRMSF